MNDEEMKRDETAASNRQESDLNRKSEISLLPPHLRPSTSLLLSLSAAFSGRAGRNRAEPGRDGPDGLTELKRVKYEINVR